MNGDLSFDLAADYNEMNNTLPVHRNGVGDIGAGLNW